MAFLCADFILSPVTEINYVNLPRELFNLMMLVLLGQGTNQISSCNQTWKSAHTVGLSGRSRPVEARSFYMDSNLSR